MSLGSDQMVQCPSCLQSIALKLMQSTHLDGDCPGQPPSPDVVAVADLLGVTDADKRRRKHKPSSSQAGDFLSEGRWAKRKAIAVSAQSLMSPGLRQLDRRRKRQTSADDKTLDALLNNSIDQSALDSLKLMVAQGIDLPPEAFVCVLNEILNKDVSLMTATACYLTAIELLRMDPLIWIPVDIECDRFWQIFTQAIGQTDSFMQSNDLAAFRKSMMFARLFILAFHRDIRHRKSEGQDCRHAILRKQIEMAASKKTVPLSAFIEELDQVCILAQIAIADDASRIPKRFRIEALGLAETFQRMMNNCFPDLER